MVENVARSALSTATRRAVLALGFFASAQTFAVDIDAQWDYSKPAETEARFREALKTETGDDVLEIITQIARTHSLRREFARAHATLDTVRARLSETTRPAVRVRYLLERGRTFRSAGETSKALPLFLEAWESASREKLVFLTIDAAHMMGIAETGERSQLWNQRAMAAAMSSNAPRALHWRGVIANNLGHSARERGDFDTALKHFQVSATAFGLVRGGKQLHISQWQIANTLRRMKRYDEALAIQVKLQSEMLETDDPDGYVYEEIAELYTAMNQPIEAKPYFAKAADLLSKDAWFADNEKARLARLIELAR